MEPNLKEIRNNLLKTNEYKDKEHLAYATGVIDMYNEYEKARKEPINSLVGAMK